MDNVWIVWSGYDEDRSIVGVFSSRDKVDGYMRRWQECCIGTSDEIDVFRDIEAVPVDTTLPDELVFQVWSNPRLVDVRTVIPYRFGAPSTPVLLGTRLMVRVTARNAKQASEIAQGMFRKYAAENPTYLTGGGDCQRS